VFGHADLTREIGPLSLVSKNPFPRIFLPPIRDALESYELGQSSIANQVSEGGSRGLRTWHAVRVLWRPPRSSVSVKSLIWRWIKSTASTDGPMVRQDRCDSGS